MSKADGKGGPKPPYVLNRLILEWEFRKDRLEKDEKYFDVCLKHLQDMPESKEWQEYFSYQVPKFTLSQEMLRKEIAPVVSTMIISLKVANTIVETYRNRRDDVYMGSVEKIGHIPTEKQLDKWITGFLPAATVASLSEEEGTALRMVRTMDVHAAHVEEFFLFFEGHVLDRFFETLKDLCDVVGYVQPLSLADWKAFVSAELNMGLNITWKAK